MAEAVPLMACVMPLAAPFTGLPRFEGPACHIWAAAAAGLGAGCSSTLAAGAAPATALTGTTLLARAVMGLCLEDGDAWASLDGSGTCVGMGAKCVSWLACPPTEPAASATTPCSPRNRSNRG
jgi:hypothetical protein